MNRPVEGGDGVALLLRIDDVTVHIADSDFGGGLVGPGEEEPHIAGVVAVGSGVGMLPP